MPPLCPTLLVLSHHRSVCVPFTVPLFPTVELIVSVPPPPVAVVADGTVGHPWYFASHCLNLTMPRSHRFHEPCIAQ